MVGTVWQKKIELGWWALRTKLFLLLKSAFAEMSTALFIGEFVTLARSDPVGKKKTSILVGPIKNASLSSLFWSLKACFAHV